MLSVTPSSTGGLPSYAGYPQLQPAIDDLSTTAQPVPASYPTLSTGHERLPLTVSAFSLSHHIPEIYPTLPTAEPAQFYNPYIFSRMAYVVPVPVGVPVIQDQSPIVSLRQSLDQHLPGFNPYPGSHDCDHIIHQQLFDLLSRFLASCENWPLDKKIGHCEKAVSEIVYGLMPEEQKTSYELLSIWSRLPKYELLEIAVRNHLFQGMLLQQKNLIADVYRRDKKFLSDLGDRQAGLLSFASKNNQYCSPYYFDISHLMVDHNLLDVLIDDTISQAPDHLPLDASIIAYEKLVTSKLKELQLEIPSQTSNYFEFNLRNALSQKLISKQAQFFKEKFQQKETFTAEEMRAAAEQIFQFAKYRNPEIQLLAEIFELDTDDISPFDAVRSSIHEKEVQLIQNLSSNRTEPGFWARLIHKKEPSLESCVAAIQAHTIKQLETIDWAEQRWNELQIFIPVIPTHDLPVTPSAPPPEQAPLLPDQIPVYIPPPSPIPTPPVVDLPTPPSPPPIESPVIHPPLSERIVDLTPHAPEPVLVRATDLSIPLVSYVDLAFDDLLKNPNDQETWKSLPELIQIDVLRHTFHYKSCEGKAEDIARRLFKTTPALQRQFAALNKMPHSIETKDLSEEFVNTGRKLLELYYSPQAIREPYHFIQEFKKLPKEPRFFQYVYEMAKSAGVHIEPWDHHFAEYNWDRPGMIALSVQALERCLHTTPRGGA